MKDKRGFVGKRVDGIYHVVETFQLELRRCFGRVDRFQADDFCLGADAAQAVAEHVCFIQPHGLRSGGQLAVDVALAHAVGVDHCDMPHAGANKAFGAPASHAAHAEKQHARLFQALQCIGTEEELCAVEYFAIHIIYSKGRIREEYAPNLFGFVI